MGGEVDWFTSSSTCSAKVQFGVWDDEEEENKRVIESEGAEGGGTGAEGCGPKK